MISPSVEKMEVGREYSEVELKDLFELRRASGVSIAVMDDIAAGNVTERKSDPNDVMSDTFYTRVK
jgi:alpha-D-ribose 1-methylphosphonate 5-triphosphate diphosphatase PhnM